MITNFAVLDSGIYSKTRKTGMTVLIGIAEHVYHRHENAEDYDLLRTFE